MLLRAIDKGLSPQHVADALNIDITTVRQKRRLLDGICLEVVDLLKERHVAINVFSALKRMKPFRQIEAVELMLAVDRITVPYIRALLAATPEEDLVQGKANKHLNVIPHRKTILMQQETVRLDSQFKAAEQSFGRINLELILAKGYMRRLMESPDILQFLIDNHRDMAAELRTVCRRQSD